MTVAHTTIISLQTMAFRGCSIAAMQRSSNSGIRFLTILREPVSLTLLLLLLVAIAECIYLARANSTFASQGARRTGGFAASELQRRPTA